MIFLLVTAALFLPAPASVAAGGRGAAAAADLHRPAADLFPPAALADTPLLPEGGGDHPETGLLLAAKSAFSDMPASPPASPYVSSFSTARAHQFMGYGTIALAALTALTSSHHDFHRAASYATLWLAGATCATGFSGYRGFIDFSDGLSAYDAHAVLGALGTIGFAATLVIAEADGDEAGHTGIGAGSAIAMGVSVAVIQFQW
jgi:hypothetical protein